MAQRKRQTTSTPPEPARPRPTLDRPQRPVIEPRPLKKRLWLLVLATAALVVWAAFLVAMVLH